ncbi:MAG: hypothetical protein U0R26_12025 [Solirubrobacterales bacterium]
MRRLLVLAPLLLCLLVLPGCAVGAGGERSADPSSFPRRATVAYAVDGDTLRVRLASGDLLYVRLVGRLPRVSSPTLRAPAVAIG